MSAAPFDPDGLAWVDLAEPSLGLALQAPATWSRGEHPAFSLLLLAPPERGYRANVGFSAKAIDPPTEDRFRSVVDATLEVHARTYEGHEELGRGFVEVGGRAGVAVHYRWRPAGLGRLLDSLLVAVPTGPDRFVEIDASAEAVGEDPLAPARAIVATVRFVP